MVKAIGVLILCNPWSSTSTTLAGFSIPVIMLPTSWVYYAGTTSSCCRTVIEQ